MECNTKPNPLIHGQVDATSAVDSTLTANAGSTITTIVALFTNRSTSFIRRRMKFLGLRIIPTAYKRPGAGARG